MQEGTVRVSGLNLRESLKTGIVVKKLRKNSKVTILGTETWHRVRTRDGQEGVVFGDYVEVDHEPSVPAVGAAAEAAVEATAGVTAAPSSTSSLQLKSYQNDRVIGSVATVDADLVPHLDRIAGFAEECKLKVHVTSSLRDPDGGISNAIVTPAKGSNHFVGHAIDMNLQLDSGEFFNSSKLQKLADQPKEVRDFIQKVQDDPELRWGGDFRTPDVVHIDDGLNLRQPDVWKTKFESRG